MAECSGSDIVQYCCDMLIDANSDVEKIAVLLFAAQQVKSEECDSRSKALLFKSVGAEFLTRMLLGRLRVPESNDCPKEVCQSTALTIITSFCTDSQLAENKEMLKLIPVLLQVIEESQPGDPVLDDAFQFVKCILHHDKGKLALIAHGCCQKLAKIYPRLKSNDIIEITMILAPMIGCSDLENFTLLISGIASEFEVDNSNKKFKLCTSLFGLLNQFKCEVSVSEEVNKEWPLKVLKGLRDILTSRIDHHQREPALKLASIMVEIFGIQWAALPEMDKARQFQLLLVHLSSIEIRMQLEDQPLMTILKNVELIVSCFTLLETAVSTFLSEFPEIKEKDQVVTAFGDAASAVLLTTKSIIADTSSKKNTKNEETLFVFAMVRFLSVGLAHNVVCLEETVYEVMPFVMSVAENSFVSYQRWYECCYDQKDGSSSSTSERPVDLMTVLLPALWRLAAENEGRKLIMSRMDLYLDYLNFHWSVLKQRTESDQEACTPEPNDVAQPEKISTKNEVQSNSNNAMVCTCELIMDTVVLQSDEIGNNPKLCPLFDLITQILPDLENLKMKSLHAASSVLGLLLIRHGALTFSEEDPSVILVAQSSTRFLKPYFNNRSNSGFLGSRENVKYRVNVEELWCLGMHTLRHLLKAFPWLKPQVEERLSSEIMEYLYSDEEIPCIANDTPGLRPS